MYKFDVKTKSWLKIAILRDIRLLIEARFSSEGMIFLTYVNPGSYTMYIAMFNTITNEFDKTELLVYGQLCVAICGMIFKLNGSCFYRSDEKEVNWIEIAPLPFSSSNPIFVARSEGTILAFSTHGSRDIYEYDIASDRWAKLQDKMCLRHRVRNAYFDSDTQRLYLLFRSDNDSDDDNETEQDNIYVKCLDGKSPWSILNRDDLRK